MGLPKKALGLGVGAGFIGGVGMGAAGTMATYSVYHRYNEFKRLMFERDPFYSWDDYYYRTFYNRNQCFFGCPINAHCQWGICECDPGTVKQDGRCYLKSQPLPPDQRVVDPFQPCSDSGTCLDIDINLVCGKNGTCTCRNDMRWNMMKKECQLYLDVDCSSITYDTNPSPAILDAVKKANETLEENLLGEVIPFGRIETKNESLSNSLLTQIAKNNASDSDLKEAFCRDIDAFSFEFQPINETESIPYPKCSKVPDSACAVAYDKHDCDGGWKLVIPQGQLRFRWFTSYWKYRNDMETVGVHAGCSLQLFSDSSFNHYTVGIEARLVDRWEVLGDTQSYQHMKNDVESLTCFCQTM